MLRRAYQIYKYIYIHISGQKYGFTDIRRFTSLAPNNICKYVYLYNINYIYYITLYLNTNSIETHCYIRSRISGSFRARFK